jgi:hypothetical protein
MRKLGRHFGLARRQYAFDRSLPGMPRPTLDGIFSAGPLQGGRPVLVPLRPGPPRLVLVPLRPESPDPLRPGPPRHSACDWQSDNFGWRIGPTVYILVISLNLLKQDRTEKRY